MVDGVARAGRRRATWLPATRYEVVREPGCEVMAATAWPSARYTVTVRLERGARSKVSGSDTTCAPAGTTTEARPWKVTGRAVPGLDRADPGPPAEPAGPPSPR